jgi:hypothetical protein
MRKFTQLSFAAGVSLALATPGFAEPGNVLYDLIDTSVGYTSLGGNDVLIQGSSNPEICRFFGSDAYFDAVVAGDDAAKAAAKPQTACVPLSAFSITATGTGLDSVYDLATAIDESEGYISVSPGTLVVEGYEQIDLCRFSLPDAYFDAVIAGEEPAEGDHPSVVCLPLNEVFQ